jgi:hypothetical protein
MPENAPSPGWQSGYARPEGRPMSTWAQIISAGCACFTAAAAILAVIQFFLSVQAEKTKAAEESVARLYAMENELERLHITSDYYTRDLFQKDQEGKHYHELIKDTKLLAKFRSICALNANMFEYYLLIRKNIQLHPKGQEISKATDYYFERSCVNSWGFRTYINGDRGVWTESFLQEFDRYSAGLDFDKK